MDVIAFFNTYSAGRAKLGQVMPPNKPVILAFLYRAFPMMIRSPIALFHR